MNRQIKYVGFYTPQGSKHARASCVAAIDKMDYICDVLNRRGFATHIVSPSWITDRDAPFCRASKISMGPLRHLTSAPSFGARTKPFRLLRILLALSWLFLYLVRHTEEGETVLVYHSPWLSVCLRWAKRIRGFRIVLEAEEVYADARPVSKVFATLERSLLASSDAFLFPTELLAEKLSFRKPFAIVYGRYQALDSVVSPAPDGKIHLLYAGIIDVHKKGAFNAVESTRYLPSNYVLHVVGFGDIARLEARIKELSRDGECQIFFDGQKQGVDYIRYAQACHIGLSTQTMEGAYLQTSFPSKILSYLCMGLRVVSCRVECVVRSKVSGLVTYYERDTPEDIAKAILSMDLSRAFDSRATLYQLDSVFGENLEGLLEGGLK